MDRTKTQDTIAGVIGWCLIGGIAYWWFWSEPAKPMAPPVMTAEQTRLYGECVKAYDTFGPWMAGDMVTWCNRALRSNISQERREFAVATAIEKYGSILMESPVDEALADRTREEIAKLRDQNGPEAATR